MRHDGDLFALELPKGWMAKASETTTHFFRSDGGKGALTVSTLTPPAGTAATVEAVLSLQGNPANVTLLESSTPGHAIARWDETGEATFWRRWVVVRPHRVALASYNCDHTERGEEVEAAERAIETLRLK